MAFNSANILQSRDMIPYVAPYASSNAMPALAAWGVAWGAPYRDMGGTDGGLGFNVEHTFEDVGIDQSIDPVAVIVSGRNIRLSAQLAEFTMQNLKDASSQGSLATVSPSSGVRGSVTLNFDTTINVNYLTVGFDVKHAIGDAESVQFMAWRAQVRSAVSGTISAGSKLILPFEVQAFPDPNNSNRVLAIRDVTPALP